MAAKQILACKGSRLPPLPSIRELIRLYQLRAIKQLSQNFLMDQRLTDKIVKAAGKIENKHVLEVGPGPGSITRSIIQKGPKHLVVVEKDRRFIPSLEILSEATKNMMQFDIVRDDILRYPIETAFPDCEKVSWKSSYTPVHLIGNLPFAISTRLLINWLRDISLQQGAWSYGKSSLTLTFQKEVAERITAPILSEQRCRLSVMNQIWSKPELKFVIPGKAFVPKPDVDVGVVTIVPLIEPLTDLHFDLVEKVVRHIFAMRQKYCRRCIGTLFPEDIREELTAQVLEISDIDPTTRSYQLSVAECLRIASAYNDIIRGQPHIANYNYRASKNYVETPESSSAMIEI